MIFQNLLNKLVKKLAQNEAIRSQVLENEYYSEDQQASFDKLRKQANNNFGKNTQQKKNNFTILNYNPQSWATDIHPNGREHSSWVDGIEYTGDNNKLRVQFRGGATCEYDGITPDQAKAFNEASSKGRWVWRNLYNRPYKKV